MKVLAIDTSNQALAVAICENDQVIGQYLGTTNRNHSLVLMPAIDFLMKENKISPKELDRIIVAEGPGSYTGLRIGVTTAKTLAWTLGIDLVGVSSLAALAANSVDFSGYIVPLFNARRENVYTGVYQWQEGKLISIMADRHVALASWLEELQQLDGKLRFVGTDVAAFKESLIEVYPESVSEQWLINEVNGLSLAKLGIEVKPVLPIESFVPKYLKLVEAEENWLANHDEQRESYVEKI
ncbi:tRNA (adenosine(37)-N6)-threonylcarbamoyltransferase complex dimerization subunit type 1 TsaB [uncultured Vagococcus sp.]|uniref:tRNA (adenosine(37)-N6)-threonylcarbamoyltransferase complex dimerization subunit type 1 TsaB n=1 Tax=uncultured Vagococcus sp. TaxID=189676 RepID=UPI0028D5D9F4|nr:tRNA (adenosine(37)-N6)-threonylcarbamoyltransferase complex dimerization subunit type 1 TsaB [uncultured Vagococcus sp.]